MFTRPPLLPLVVGLCSTTFVAALSITPIFVSHDEPPGEAVRFWWARVAPRSYALYALRSARVFALPSHPDYCTDPQNPVQAWQRIAADPAAESVFAHLLVAPRPSTRLYALAGLARVHARALSTALARSRADTSHVLVWIAPGRGLATVRVSDVVNDQATRAWSVGLSQLGMACAA